MAASFFRIMGKIPVFIFGQGYNYLAVMIVPYGADNPCLHKIPRCHRRLGLPLSLAFYESWNIPYNRIRKLYGSANWHGDCNMISEIIAGKNFTLYGGFYFPIDQKGIHNSIHCDYFIQRTRKKISHFNGSPHILYRNFQGEPFPRLFPRRLKFFPRKKGRKQKFPLEFLTGVGGKQRGAFFRLPFLGHKGYS